MRRAARRAALLLAAAAVPAAAQQPQELSARVDRVFAEYQRPGSPGCALGVVRDGRLVYTRGYGLANLEHDVPITPRTVFDIGSTSKQVTAASVALLAQEGRLSLEDDVRRWLPELPDYGRTITIRHLLNHTSGLRDYLTLMSLAGISFDGVTTAKDALDIIVRQRELNFPPGEQYLYSNSGYFLLSQIVERASGVSLREYAQRRLFEPLGMRDTHFHDDHTEVVPRRATGYARGDDGGYRVAMSGFEQTGDGAVYTTVEDLARWDRNFYEPAVGGRALLEALHTRGVLNSGDTLTYGLGLVVDRHRGLPTVSHGGSWAGYRAELLRFPEQRFSAIVLCNLAGSDPSALAREVAEVYLGERMRPAEAARAERPERAAQAATPPALPPTEQGAYAGRYHSEEIAVDYTIARKDGALVLRRPGAAERALVPAAKGEFAAGPLRLRFARDAAGAVTGFVLDAGRTRNLRFRRVSPQPE